MDTPDTGLYCRIDIGHGQVIVIMRMEIKMYHGIALHHTATVLLSGIGVENSQRIGQHHALYRHRSQGIHQVKDIFGRAFHSVAPVLQINVHLHAAAHSILNGAAYIPDMLIGRLAQLRGNVLEAALAEQVHYAAAGHHYPISRAVLIHKSQHLHAAQQTVALRPLGNTLHAILLAVRYHGRCNLHAVHIQVRQQ